MPTITPSTFQFLNDLKSHNDRDWFKANKARYEQARENFVDFIEALFRQIATFDPGIAHHDPRSCIFRIHRDVRFSKDKSPYKTHFGAHITPAAKRSDIHSKAGYYIHLEPGASMLAGGAYMPQGDWLKAIRQEIEYEAEAFEQILNHPDFKKYFGEMEGEKLKTKPKGYDADHPQIEWLRHKSFLAVHNCSDEDVLSDGFLSHCTDVFRAMQPFDQFLNRTMD